MVNTRFKEKIQGLRCDNGDKSFWGDAALTAIYLINRTHTSAVEKTPSEIRRGRKPEMHKIRKSWSQKEGIVEIGSNEEEEIENMRKEDENRIEERNNTRKSTRTRKIPTHLQDYDVEYDANLVYALAVGHIPGEIPKTFSEPERSGWKEDINEGL
ncbi:hypothetical protein WA026_021788 [Henosepilachna vigintioctopunctata]|uniref:Uncharacterized protein n=1 Tax=Henosepilachna vigintioctopunctata TaxID=420089 RepID=A0AAW1U1P3_9CUCU